MKNQYNKQLEEDLLLAENTHNEDLAKQQKHLEMLYNVYFQQQLVNEADQIHRAAQSVVSYQLAKERSFRLSQIQLMSQNMLEMESHLNRHTLHTEFISCGSTRIFAIVEQFAAAEVLNYFWVL